MLRSFGIGVFAATLLSAATAVAQVTHYRSIGTALDYSAGSVAVVTGETLVIGTPSVQWLIANRGRGDNIDLAGVDYTILSVDAANELTLTTPYAGPAATGVGYTISRKFLTLKDWEACIDNGSCPGVFSKDLAADNRIEVGVAYKDSVFDVAADRLQIDNMITDATHTITLTVTPANRHHGVAGTGVILDSGNSGSNAIEIQVDYVTIEWLEVRFGNKDLIQVHSQNTANEVVLRNLILHDDDGSHHGILIDDEEVNVLAYNNVVYGTDHGVEIKGLKDNSTGTKRFFHNTFFKNSRGIFADTNTALKNDVIFLNSNLAHSNPTADFEAVLPNPSSSHNYSGDSTGPLHGSNGMGLIPLPNVQFVSTTTGSEDLHIRRGSDAENKGPVIAAVVDDLDGRARSLPDIGADETESSSANAVKILSATSRDTFVQLEWQNPDYGPMDRVEIIRSPTAYPTLPSDGALSCTDFAPVAGTKGSCADALLLVNGTKYYYSAFVYDTGSNFSPAESVNGQPINVAALPTEWSYSTKAATLEAPGVRSNNAFAVSNDKFFHAMQGGLTGTSGEWPLAGGPPWAPYEMPSPVQHRPVIVNVAGRQTALLGAQDGRVYAVDAESGRLRWRSKVVGSINAAPAALVGAYGASVDCVFVGTANAGSNALIALDLQTGVEIGRFIDGGNPDNIGAITGIAVNYPSGPVYFTSVSGPGVSPRNIWAIDATTLAEHWSDSTGPIDGGPTLYNGLLFVGTRASELMAYDVAVGDPWLWQINFSNGPVKAPIFPVWPHDTVVFTTNDAFHSVQFTATGGCGSPPCLNCGWSFGATASPVLQIPSYTQAYIGLGNGNLHELDLDTAAPMNCPVNRTFTLSSSPLGAPSFSAAQDTIYISDTSGKVYAIPWPVP